MVQNPCHEANGYPDSKGVSSVWWISDVCYSVFKRARHCSWPELHESNPHPHVPFLQGSVLYYPPIYSFRPSDYNFVWVYLSYAWYKLGPSHRPRFYTRNEHNWRTLRIMKLFIIQVSLSSSFVRVRALSLWKVQTWPSSHCCVTLNLYCSIRVRDEVPDPQRCRKYILFRAILVWNT
jgi:hypothetical protein